MQSHSSNLEEMNIHKCPKEKSTNYVSLEENINGSKSERVTKADKLRERIKILQSINVIKNQGNLWSSPEVIISSLHYSCYPNGSSLVQDQLNLSDSNSRSYKSAYWESCLRSLIDN
jgi:hypothetical protein